MSEGLRGLYRVSEGLRGLYRVREGLRTVQGEGRVKGTVQGTNHALYRVSYQPCTVVPYIGCHTNHALLCPI